jgi:hypothetical protein
MSLGIVSDEEFNKQLGEKQPEVRAPNAIIVPAITPGRTPDKTNTPSLVRKFIAEEALNGTPVKDLADNFNISPSSISAYKVGSNSTTTYDKPDRELKSHTDNVRNGIAVKARNRLRDALIGITPAKLADVKARDLAGIAKDMSAVIKNIEPQSDGDRPNVQFIFYRPRQREESDYDTIQVLE